MSCRVPTSHANRCTETYGFASPARRGEFAAVVFRMRLLCLVVLSSFAASSALRLRATATARHSQPRCQFKTGEGEPVGDDKAQRRQNLKDLFGEQAADSLAPLTKSERAEAQVDEILMLQEGMQSLSWGGIRLVDVDMAPYATQGSNPGLAEGPRQPLPAPHV